ncbi:hypothetical protein BD289DRAFT_452420 [Coniella lustricola]|uniref:Nuclear GTPase SLIP-GC n=1 Tax=Coniella lustricola TaxID=2025994 RepID=A0A2T3ABB9_9PEZI|nr:hypothetical protein BD289DRAFT_452420 [Coniella lustricola]
MAFPDAEMDSHASHSFSSSNMVSHYEFGIKSERPDTAMGFDVIPEFFPKITGHARYNTTLSLESGQASLDAVRSVIDCQNLEKLKEGVTLARSILQQLRTPVAESQQQIEGSDWLSKINELLATRIETGRTVVAVVGPTGAGKSSLINSLLNEEELLPTNGYRACTAVATEIFYKECSNPAEAYGAEIQFCSKEEWEVELNHILADLQDHIDESDDSREADRAAWKDSETEAGKAFAKLRAIFPTANHSSLLQAKAADLLQDSNLQDILGTTESFKFETARELANVLNKYLESTEAEYGMGLFDGNMNIVEVWPLIKLVRVHCPAPALSTGLVIIDLPGFEDSNSVRSSIGYRFLSEANAIYIAAPIQRAVNDKTARNLLGKTFRMQMMMDNNISNVVFICTKIEDINPRESMRTHDKDHQIRAIFHKQEELKKSISKQELEMKGNRVKSASHKRLSTKRKLSALSSDLEEDTALLVTRRGAKDVSPTLEVPVTENKTICDDAAAGDELESLRKQLVATKADFLRMCIQMRNADSVRAIKRDFARGIRDIDDDEQSSNETSDYGRDYELIAESLPVHCVSSYGYQHLKTHVIAQESLYEGFKSLEDTGIPGLVKHGKKLTRSDEIMKHKSYLNNFLTLVSSFVMLTASCHQLTVSASCDGRAAQLSEKDRRNEMEYIDQRIEILQETLKAELQRAQANVQKTLRSTIAYANSHPVKVATKAAAGVVDSWSALEKNGGHGIRLNTYKAICRRQGQRTSSLRARDFNADLLEKYLAAIARRWEILFGTTIPQDVDRLNQIFADQVHKFHDDMSRRPVLKETRSGSLVFLAKSCKEHENTIMDILMTWQNTLRSEQQEASRSFYTYIQAAMKPAYERCALVSGKGCYKTIREIMANEMTAKKKKLFGAVGKNALGKVEISWNNFIQEFEATISELINDTIAKDYKTMITAGEMMESSAIALGRCHVILSAVDKQFQDVIDREQETQ